jgi:hypothetical protein
MAQGVPGGSGGDPTPFSPIQCTNIFTPPPPSTLPLVCPWSEPNPRLQIALNDQNQSWLPITNNPLPWQPFRQPAIILQMWNGSHDLDPYGLNWWWGRFQRATAAGQTPIADEDLDRNSVRLDSDGYPEYFVQNPDENGDGVPDTNGKKDKWEAFEAHLDYYYEKIGIRRFILKLPGGNVIDQDFNVNQWQMMPAWKQELFSNYNSAFNVWRRRPDRQGAVFEVYVGGPIPLGLCSPCFRDNPNPLPSPPITPLFDARSDANLKWVVNCTGQAVSEQFVPWNQRHVDLMVEALKPWVDAGFKGIWLDAINENAKVPSGPTPLPGERANAQRRRGLLELAYMPIFRNQQVRIGAETFPARWFPNTGGNAATIDDCAVGYTRWFGLGRVATTWDPNAQPPTPKRAFHNNNDWFFDRSKSEVLIALAAADRGSGIVEAPWSFDEIGEARRRGFVLAMYNTRDQKAPTLGAMMRWYSMGKIEVADFNGDGDVNEADRQKFDTEFAISFANPTGRLAVFATGDVYPDGVFDGNDQSLFYFYWNQGRSNGIQLRDYGPADEDL